MIYAWEHIQYAGCTSSLYELHLKNTLKSLSCPLSNQNLLISLFTLYLFTSFLFPLSSFSHRQLWSQSCHHYKGNDFLMKTGSCNLKSYAGLWFLRIFPDYRIFNKSLFASKKRSSRQGKKQVACIVSKPLGFLFVGMWRVCKSSKIIHSGRSGGFVLQTKGGPGPTTHFAGFVTFVKSHFLLWFWNELRSAWSCLGTNALVQ